MIWVIVAFILGIVVGLGIMFLAVKEIVVLPW